VFDIVRRGYDCGQVDEHLHVLMTTLTDYQRAHRSEHGRADRAEADLRTARADLTRRPEAVDRDQGFGYRVEKLMRAAEQEAADVRAGASNEATALLENAREDAERHRHEVEQALIARNVALEHDAARRRVELDERERRLGEQMAATRDEADRILSDGNRKADQLLHNAQVRAETEKQEAGRVIRERQAASEAELTRLRTLHDEVLGQLARMLEALAGEFEQSSPRHPRPVAAESPREQTSREQAPRPLLASAR
jgi:cell division septum initiation protein DivIVA